MAHSQPATLKLFAVLFFLLLASALTMPGAARASVVPWTMPPGATNEVVYTLSIDCAGGGLVCSALDAYSDVQVATIEGAGDLEVDLVAGTIRFLQDGTQDVGGGPQPSYATVDAEDLTFAAIPFVGAPVTDEGVIFALTNPVFSAGGPLFVGSHPIAAVVDYSAITDIVGPVDAWVPEIVVAPQGVTLNGTLAILGLSPGGGVFYQIHDLTGTMVVSNPTTLLGEDVTVNVTAELTLNLQGNTSPGGGVSELPALGAWGVALLAGGIALAGARIAPRRTRS